MMMCRQVVFCEVIRGIGLTRSPINMELSLFNLVLYPIESHVLHGFGLALPYLFVGKYVGGRIVHLYWGGWLGMANFSKGIHNATPSFVLLKRVLHYSASAAKAMTFRMMMDVVRIAPSFKDLS
jgi:hypothetical protein